jgi:hypothetical protein
VILTEGVTLAEIATITLLLLTVLMVAHAELFVSLNSIVSLLLNVDEIKMVEPELTNTLFLYHSYTGAAPPLTIAALKVSVDPLQRLA